MNTATPINVRRNFSKNESIFDFVHELPKVNIYEID